MKELEYIDFYEKKKSLHKEMLSEIKKMFVLADIKEIDFSNLGSQYNWNSPDPFIVLSPDGYTSTYETIVKKLIYKNGVLEVVIPDYENPIGLGISDSVCLCTIDSIYDAVHHYVSRLLHYSSK